MKRADSIPRRSETNRVRLHRDGFTAAVEGAVATRLDVPPGQTARASYSTVDNRSTH